MSEYNELNSMIEDPEVRELLKIASQKAEIIARVHEFNEICWDKCVQRPGSKLDGKAEACLSNCVDRFIDTSMLITKSFYAKKAAEP